MAAFAILCSVAMNIVTSQSHPNLYAVIGYCPTPFTSEGAVITIDSQTGEYSIKGTLLFASCLFNAILSCKTNKYITF